MARRHAPKPLPKNPKRNVVDNEDYLDDDAVAESQSQTREMQMLEKKIREIRKPKSTQNFVRKFSERVRSQEDAMIMDLEQRYRNIIASSKKTSDEITSIFTTVTNVHTLENHPLRESQDVLLAFAHEIMTIHHPIQETIKELMENELQLPVSDWAQNIKDANTALEMMKDERLQTVDKLLSEGGKTGDGGHHWGHAVKRSGQGIRKALQIAPIPTDVGNQFDISV